MLNITVTAKAAASSPQGFWVWAGVPLKNPDPQATLYLFQGHFRNIRNEVTFTYEGPSPRPLPTQVAPVVLTYRLSLLVPPKQVVRHYRQHKWAWESHNISVAGLQIDFDCPTSKLAEYGKWLAKLQKEINQDEQLSITGLGDWLVSASPKTLKKLARQTDFIAFMIYHKGRPLVPLTPYTKRLSMLRLPFRVGLLQHQHQSLDLQSVRIAKGYLGDIVFLTEAPLK